MNTDVAIVGSGPAGSSAAIQLARRGIESVIVEKVPFPRYHIGESLTGEAGGLLRGLGFEEPMRANCHPVKHGVKVYGPSGSPWFVPVMQRTEEGTLRDQVTWQVRRSDFDSMLHKEAERAATIIPGKAVRPLLTDDGAVRGLLVRPAEGGELELEADLVLDCSGQATFLATHGLTGPKYLGAYDKQIAIFSQVTGFERDSGTDGARDEMPDNTLTFYKSKFHWAWAIPLDDEVVSVGVVIPAEYFLDCKETKEDFLRRELRELSDELSRRLPTIELVEDVHVIPNYSFQVAGWVGKGFMCVGDAHRFIDPIFSPGVFVAMKEASFAAQTAARYLGDGHDPQILREHMIHCDQGIDIFEDMIDTFWENPIAFAALVHMRCRDEMIDIFAGRIYAEDGQPSSAVFRLRKLLQRERTYDSQTHESLPIGSRYHPERAALWNATLDSVETTERWMRETEMEEVA
ncbi:MAG TPA: NAD(P)/FAD-dependent oxidoreductase [Gaiellaceae bacterium]|jgi:flavin-dependent dehydrogenase